MATTNITIRLEESVKKEFDRFCDNVGVNITSAVTMFIKAVLRTRQFPFTIMDTTEKEVAMAQAREALKAAQTQSHTSGLSEMTMDEIDAEIALARKEMRGLL